MAIRWVSTMEVGLYEVDSQHKEMIVKMNELLSACVNGKGKEEIVSMVEFLQNYVIIHFDTEEKLMLKTNYPHYVKHFTVHKKFISSFIELKAIFLAEGPTSKFITDFNTKVVTWLFDHIAEMDREMGIYVAKHLAGVK